jgi:hypothetical protein
MKQADLPSRLAVRSSTDRRPKKERRRERRRKALKTARLYLDGRAAGIEGIIHNLSPTGAQLELPGDHQLKRSVVLYLPTENIRIDARVVWQRGRQLGLEFSRRLGWLER